MRFFQDLNFETGDFEIDFEGTIDGDELEGVFHMMATPVKGHKISK